MIRTRFSQSSAVPAPSRSRSVWALTGVGLTLTTLALSVAIRGLEAQERLGTLVPVSRLSVPDSVPLTRIEQLVPGADGSVFLLDARTESVLTFDSAGVFRGRIGRRGEGPGEFLNPWRLGLLGDTLWVVDGGRPRVNLYNAATGSNLSDFSSGTWDRAAAGGESLRPYGILADHRLVAVKWVEPDAVAEFRAYRPEGGRVNLPGVSLALLDVRDRSIVVSLPGGGAGLRLRNPFSYSDMLAIDPSGRHIAVIRRREMADADAHFRVELIDVLGDHEDAINVPYEPRPLDSGDVRAWAADQGAVARMVELGVLPSRTAGVAAVLDALDEPGHHPPVRNRGRGIIEESVLLDRDGTMWFDTSQVFGGGEWLVVAGKDVSRVSAPEDIRLLAVRGEDVWAETRDGFGVPTVHRFRVRASDR